MNLIKILNYDLSYNNRLIKLNNKTQKYGLILTEKNVAEIIEERANILKENRMVELDIKITEEIIDHLSSSPFVDNDNFVETILGIQEVFYYIKSETDMNISDEKLLDILFDYFDDRGSIELLSGRDVDVLIRQMNLSY